MPAGTLLHVSPYGALVLVPSSVPPAKNCTWVTVPSLSAAVAASVIVAGAVKLAFAGGDVSVTVGGQRLHGQRQRRKQSRFVDPVDRRVGGRHDQGWDQTGFASSGCGSGAGATGGCAAGEMAGRAPSCEASRIGRMSSIGMGKITVVFFS